MVLAGCSFDAKVATTVDGPTDTVDMKMADPLPPSWIVVGMSRGASPRVRIFPFSGTELATTCAEQPSTTSTAFALRDLLPHPTMPVTYGVDAGLRTLGLSCTSITLGTSTAGTPRLVQQIVRDPASGVGFYTADGAGAVGVYRFTTDTTGTPTVTGSANAPSAAGALALDVANAQLFVAGAGTAQGYDLVGLDFVAPGVGAAMCLEPMRLAVSGAFVLAFCANENHIRRYVRSPFAIDPVMPEVGALGPVDQVAALPGDRVVVARKAPTSDLVVVSNNGGLPSWGQGPPVASRVLAMAASADGRTLATARVTGTSSSELAIWRIEANAITLEAVTNLDTVVTALAVTTPGT